MGPITGDSCQIKVWIENLNEETDEKSKIWTLGHCVEHADEIQVPLNALDLPQTVIATIGNETRKPVVTKVTDSI